MKAIILAGGGGTRLWPLSRQGKPKQAQKIIGNDTLLQKTFKRLRREFSLADIYVSCGQKHLRLIGKQIPNLPLKNYVLEPTARNTAGAIGLTAVILHKKNPSETISMANSDQYIKNEKEYIRILRTAEKVLKKYPDHTLLIGINPTYPETGYGYIEMGDEKDKFGQDKIFAAKRFVEKPDLKTAESYLKKWNYLWNPAIFVWRVDHLLNLFRKHLPRHYLILKNIENALGTKNEKATVKREFARLESISIDFGLMEKIKEKMLVLPADIGWTDVGHWRSVKEVLSETAEENVILGEHVGYQTKGSLIYNLSEKLVATAGVEDMIIVNTKDALLICPREKAQEVKNIVEILKKKKKEEYL
ncbi:MAG: sugar phosphate nucleotidyltransferase [Patescibacteria group bacterium]